MFARRLLKHSMLAIWERRPGEVSVDGAQRVEGHDPESRQFTSGDRHQTSIIPDDVLARFARWVNLPCIYYGANTGEGSQKVI